MSTEATEPAEVERVSPPFKRDKLAHLWIVTRAMSGVTDTIWSIGLAWTAVQVGSPAAAGVVVAAGTVPRALLLMFGGTFADRFDIRQVLIWSNVGQLSALAAVLVASTAAEPSYPLLIAAAAILGACDAMYEPAAATIARQIVHPSDLPAYTGVYQTVGRLGELFGSAAGGVVVAYWSIQGTAVLNIAAFGGVLLVLLFGLRLRYPIAKVESGSILRSVLGGFAHLKDAPLTRTLVLSQMLLNVFIVPPLGLGITLRTRELGLGAEVVGYVGVAVGIGATVGALLTIRFKAQHPARLAYILFAVEGLAIALLGVGGVETLYVGASTMGLCAGAASSMLGAVFIAQLKGEYTGRMMALAQVGDECLLPLSTVTFGVVVGATSATAGLAIFGLAMFIAMALPLRNRQIRRITVS
ncbi:MFS transporter [Promicromonospora xylanilytica]